MRRGRHGPDAHPLERQGIQFVAIRVIPLPHALHEELHLMIPPQRLILRRRGVVGENFAAYAQLPERRLMRGRIGAGRGVGFMEWDYTWHSKPFKPGEAEKALKELRTLGGKIKSEHE